jgi:hypothetical protein
VEFLCKNFTACIQIDLLDTPKYETIFFFLSAKIKTRQEKKTILIARLTKCKAVAVNMEMGKSSFVQSADATSKKKISIARFTE